MAENKFNQAALKNVQYSPGLHRASNIARSNNVVGKVLSDAEVQAFRKNHKLEMENVQRHDYAESTTYAITIPVVTGKPNIVTSLIAYVDTESNKVTNKLITIETYEDSTATYTMTDLEGRINATITLDQDFNEITGKTPIQTQESVAQCVQRYFNNLPWWAKAACAGSCGTCFGLVAPACAVCAGCLGGNALRCF